MATLETNEANILDAETINWRLIVYPLLLVLIIVAGGFGYYYYQQSQRDELEAKARAALVEAKTPDEMAKVADQYPHTDQATLALLSAADASFTKHDYASTIQVYQQIISNTATDPELRETAQLGLASAFEATKKIDDAIKAYLEVASLGAQSPHAPFAYSAIARLYEEKGDKDNERKTLTQAASLDPDSPFVKEAQFKLKEMSAPPPMTVPNPAAPAPAAAVTPAPPSAPAAPATAPAAK
jgi:predicted negative regulator of RcsB-dependent stress response